MASAFALAIFSGIFIIFFVKLKNLRIFQFYFFTGWVVTIKCICCCRSYDRRAATTNRRKNLLVKRLRFFVWSLSALGLSRASSPCLQRRRPRPAAETGRSCWGSGLQDTNAAQGMKQTQGAATRRLPRLESSGDLAALNTRHLLCKPVCGLKAPLGLSCPAGTAVLSGTLLCAQKSTFLVYFSARNPGSCCSSTASALPRWLMASFSSGVSWA